VKSFVANAAVGIASVASVLILIIVHEALAAMADGADRFAWARRWLAGAIATLVVVLAIIVIARFYYLRN
jgi:type IV secretory pathway VirB2 component (pilin)